MTWREVKLGTVVDTLVPQRDKPSDLSGPIPWVRIEDFSGQYISGSNSGQGVSATQARTLNLRVFPVGTVMCSCSCAMGATAIVATPLTCNQTFIGLVPRSGLMDSRFLYYLMSSMSDHLQSRAAGAIQQYLSRDDFRSLRVRIPDVVEQCRIADMLDVRCGSLSSLHQRLRAKMELAESRMWAQFAGLIEGCALSWVPVRRMLRSLIDGPFGSAFTSADYSDEGAVVVRLGNIGFNEYRDGNQVRIPFDLFNLFRRYRVMAGDVLIAGLGDLNNHAGRACVAPDLGDAMVKGKCFRARVDEGVVCAKYLALVLSSPLGERALSSRGSTRSMINLELVKAAELPLPSLARQQHIVAQMEATNDWAQALLAVLKRQGDVILERKQALIAAAVTGEIDVTSAVGAA